MTKTEFISKVSESIGADTAQAASVVNAVLDAITDVVAAGDSLTIPGFGTFGTVKRPERTVRNPQNGLKSNVLKSGQVLQIPEK